MGEDREAVVREAKAVLARPGAGDEERLKEFELRLNELQEVELARQIRQRREDLVTAEAEGVLVGKAATLPEAILALAERLADFKSFGLARRILKRAGADLPAGTPLAVRQPIAEKRALYTYKDEMLPLDWRLDRAFEALDRDGALAATESQESFGLAGAIFKRKWQVDGRRQNLERSLSFYLHGYSLGLRSEHLSLDRAAAKRRAALGRDPDLPSLRRDVLAYLADNPECVLWAEADLGYCGINAAFVLDLLAREEEVEGLQAGFASQTADARRAGARRIRLEILRSVGTLLRAEPCGVPRKSLWWACATLGEACFGLGIYDAAYYDEAVHWLAGEPGRRGVQVVEWMYESTARQLAHLALLQSGEGVTAEQFEASPAGRSLGRFLRDDEVAVRSAFRGRFGLGLSGGGFRASLFHIGVLARLAELDVLRHVEVLSCVSGGSIIGAHYYLEVRNLLQTKTDREITQEDYLAIVRRIEVDFLAGVQRNLRTRVLAEWLTNLKMLFVPGYSRTLRVGELYERELFAKVRDGDDGLGVVEGGPSWLPRGVARSLGLQRQGRILRKLIIKPKLEDGGLQAGFNPRAGNWRRRNKAPILVLNSTCLNTGHTWQFTATYMGEPPNPINADIDNNYRLRRMYYGEAPEPFSQLRLGDAVAASSCVPGLFEPLVFDRLYSADDDAPGGGTPVTVRLVDGGACDNQGIGSLLEQDCTVLLVSDSSGQMGTEDEPSGAALGVALRASSVSQARVREAQYTDVASRRRSSLLRGLMFIHLRQDLQGKGLPWAGCTSIRRSSDFGGDLDSSPAETSFGVARSVQQKLSAIRTDLDSFSDAEAYALMASAYRMTRQQFADKKVVPGFDGEVESVGWKFLAIEPAMREGPAFERQRRHLERHLDVGSELVFRAWRLSPALRALRWILLAGLVGGIVAFVASRWNHPLLSPQSAEAWTFGRLTQVGATIAGWSALGWLLGYLIGKKRSRLVVRALRPRETAMKIAVGLGMSTAGFLVARLHLWVFDRIFLRLGRIDKIPR